MRDESAQAVIEMALCLPLFLGVVFGMIQSSILLQTYCNATYACRNAARYASVHSTASLAPSSSTQIQAMVQSSLFLSSSITPAISVNYYNASDLSPGSDTVGSLVEVQASWSQKLVIPFMKTNSITVSTQTYRMISR